MKTSTNYTRCRKRVDVDTVDTFPFDILQYIMPCRNRVGHPTYYTKRYADIIATFDIETTPLDDIKQSVMWHWQSCIDGMVIVGRTWDEYRKFLEQVDKYLPKGLCFVQFIHNASYEFQFLRSIHDFQPNEVFCLTGRKIARFDIGNRFEFRCSYVLTNMSLREFLKKQGVEHQKTEMDYRKQRFYFTDVTRDELDYCIADVLGLYEALRKMMKADKMSIAELPMTSTGYVRNDFKHAMRKGGYISWARGCAPDYDVYLMIRRAFRGGNTHCSRFYTGVIMDNVTSYDRASSYPDVLVNYPYPVKPWTEQHITKLSDMVDGFPYLVEVELWNIRLRDPYETPCPYIAIHKCFDVDYKHTKNDNGRVCAAPYIKIYLTNIDAEIVRRQYVWDDEKIGKCYRSEYGMLPDAAIDTIMRYYRMKTELKGVVGQEVFYNKNKALL